MQATVHSFDATTRSGALIRDDGLVMPFDSDAFAMSGLRHLRLGQRLSVELDDHDTVVSLRIRGIARLGATEPIG